MKKASSRQSVAVEVKEESDAVLLRRARRQLYLQLRGRRVTIAAVEAAWKEVVKPVYSHIDRRRSDAWFRIAMRASGRA